MEDEVDYGFYAGDFKGTLSQEAFEGVLSQADGHVRWLIDNREPRPGREATAFRRAVCAAAEAFSEYGDGAVGFSLGRFKATSREGTGVEAADKATEAALRELSGTPLLFCGVR